MKKRALKICGSIVITFFWVVLLEIWSSFVIQNPAIHWDVGMQLQPHPSRIWALQPGLQRQFGVEIFIDNRQMRSNPQSTNISKSSQIWLTLGDSSIFGHALADEHTLHGQLQTQLHDIHMDAAVLCGAVPGYSILQTQRFLNEVGWSLQPKVLVLGSLWSDNNFDVFIDQEWMAVLDSPKSQMLFWLSKSSTFLWMHQVLKPAQQNTRTATKVSWVREPFQRGVRRVSLEQYAQAYLEILQEAQKRNIAVLILQPANRYRLEGMNVEATWDVYFRVQQQIAEHAQVPMIDVAAVLRLFGLSSAEAFVDELHPSATANYWIAQTIADKAISENLQDWVPNIEEDFVLTEVDYWKGTNEVNPNADLPLE